MLRIATVLSLVLLPTAAFAQAVPPVGTATGAPISSTAQRQAETGRAPSRIRNVQLTGADKCPVAQGDEIMVCNRISPDEQFRIPKQLRNTAEPAAQNQSWVNRTASADEVGRVAGGLPDTCSPVGTGGQSGCTQMWARAYAAEKRAAEKNDAMMPGANPQ
jgi:hypothetical protein